MYMANEPAMTTVERVDALILTIRGQRVMLDSDLARIYGVSTARLNQQFSRNRNRFPSDFVFQLAPAEFEGLRSQIVISKPGRGGRRKRPWVFTEHGAIMLASVLSSPVAVAASVAVVRAFVRLREMTIAHKDLAAKLDELEKNVKGHDEALKQVFQVLRQIMAPPTRAIGFHVRHESKAPPVGTPAETIHRM